MSQARREDRRHFLRNAVRAAGVVPFLALPTKASAQGDNDNDQGQNNNDQGQNNNDQGQNGRGNPACFLRGARILTDAGDVPIEKLSIGDRVKSHRGQYIPIKWIARKKYTEGISGSDDVVPVCISRHALDGRRPYADLYVSPKHRLYLNGALVPAKHLINGISVFRRLPDGIQEIEYYHIELETHEVVFAEGAAAETFLYEGTHQSFDNSAEYDLLYGAAPRRFMTPYARLIDYPRRRSKLIAALRRAASVIVDIRDPAQIAHDKVAALASGVTP